MNISANQRYSGMEVFVHKNLFKVQNIQNLNILKVLKQ